MKSKQLKKNPAKRPVPPNPTRGSERERRQQELADRVSELHRNGLEQCVRTIEIALARKAIAEAHAALDRFATLVAAPEAITLDSPVAILQSLAVDPLDTRELNRCEINGVGTVRAFMALTDEILATWDDTSIGRIAKFKRIREQLQKKVKQPVCGNRIERKIDALAKPRELPKPTEPVSAPAQTIKLDSVIERLDRIEAAVGRVEPLIGELARKRRVRVNLLQLLLPLE